MYQVTDTKPSGTWWPPLTPDICALAVGNKNWHIGQRGITLEQSKIGPSITYDLRPAWKGPQTRLKGVHCNNAERRRELQTLPFYVCPAPTQRPREQKHTLVSSCGAQGQYYCQIWDCETTGTGWWIQQPGWELIQVKRNLTNTHRYPGWVNPLNISFTLEGSKKSILAKWLAGMWWGLRLYKTAEDDGVLFGIRLREEPISPPKPLGPGVVLPPASVQFPKTPAPTPPTPRTSRTPSALAPTPIPVRGQVALIQGSFNTLNQTNPSLTTDCWLCVSASPPYYEGIAFIGNYSNLTGNQHSSCPWGEHRKLTLPEVSGVGLCIGRVQNQWKHLCNSTLRTLPEGDYYLKPPTEGWWVCNTGISPCIHGRAFNKNSEFCIMVQLVPRIYYYQANAFEEEFDTHPSPIRKKKELVSLTLAALLGIGVAAGVGTGTTALVQASKYTEDLRAAIDEDLKNIEKAITKLEESLTSLSEVVLQNRRGLDLLFLKEGGLCAALKEQCCFYADHSGVIKDSMSKLRERIEIRRRERELRKSWFEQWFDGSPWLTTLLSTLLGPLLILLLLLTIGPCILNRLVSFVRDRISAVHMLVLQQRYQPLETEISL